MSAPAVTVRPGRAEDAEAIHGALLGIAETVGELHKVRSTPEDIRNFGFGGRPRFDTLVAEVDGAFAGLCLSFASFSTWHGRPGVYVQDLYVPDRFRGLGIGRRLLARLAAETRAEGGVYIRLAVDTGNVAAQAFYARAGLAHCETERIHAAYGEDFARLAEQGERDA